MDSETEKDILDKSQNKQQQQQQMTVRAQKEWMKTQFVDLTMTSAAKHTNDTNKIPGNNNEEYTWYEVEFPHKFSISSRVIFRVVGCIDLYYKLVCFY